MNFKKLALIIVGILAAALLWMIINGTLLDMLNVLWDWIFQAIGANPAPQAPFKKGGNSL